MIIPPGSENAVSFTDDTSPDLRQEPERRVSIHAQVIRSENLSWYYTLLGLYRDINGELKSEKILANFPNLPKYKQDSVWEGLKKVRINIVDTFPHQAPLTKTLKDIFGRNDAMEMLKERAKKGDAAARHLLTLLEESVVKMVVEDAPAKQVILASNLVQHGASSLGRYLTGRSLNRSVDSALNISLNTLSLNLFKNKNRLNLTKAVKWMSKSASVFMYGIDNFLNKGNSWNSFNNQLRLYRLLQPSHAFDRGDAAAVGWIDDSRKEIVQRLAPQIHLYMPVRLSPLYGEIDSDQSYLTQASDIAAGFARQLYEQGGIVSLTEKFIYVAFNGLRITQSDAEETMRRWRQMGYVSQKNIIYLS